MFDLAEHLAKLAREVNAIADEYGRSINTRQWVSQIPKPQPITAPKLKMSFEERSRRINKLLDNRPPNVHEKPNLCNPPNEKRHNYLILKKVRKLLVSRRNTVIIVWIRLQSITVESLAKFNPTIAPESEKVC